MTAVDTAFSTSFCAVPAFIRVEPVSTSGPVPMPTSTSTSAVAAGIGAHQRRRGARLPGHPQPGEHPRRATARRHPDHQVPRPYRVRAATLSPSSTSSSAPSIARVIAASPPARWGTNQPGGTSKVGRSSTASSTASRPDVPLPR